MSQFKQCPVCGGAVHPIAGRCKHCKADLVKLEAAAARARAPQPAPSDSRPTPVASSPSTPTAAPPVPPALVYHQQSTWARRWPYIVGGIALLAIGISVGLLVSGSDPESSQRGKQAAPSRSPHMIPDNMPQPEPDIPAPQPADPQSSIPSPAWPAPSRPAPNAAPGDAPEVGLFGVALTDTVCAKLTDCGLLDDFSKLMCRELAQQLEDPEAEERVRSGECHYDKAAAAACLDAIRGLDCSSQTPDVMAWITQANSLIECTSAWVCY